jgi:hypothetical protein
LIDAGQFVWADPKDKNGKLAFGLNGSLTSDFGGKPQKGTWEVDSPNEIRVNFGKQGDITLVNQTPRFPSG